MARFLLYTHGAPGSTMADALISRGWRPPYTQDRSAAAPVRRSGG
jgi:hypothetical protein